jgi:hypothetical protein
MFGGMFRPMAESSTEFPKHKPVYDNLLVDSEGNIWVIHNGSFLLPKTEDD